MRSALEQQSHAYELHVIYDGAEALRFVREQRFASKEPNVCHCFGLAFAETRWPGSVAGHQTRSRPITCSRRCTDIGGKSEDESEVRQLGVRFVPPEAI